MAQLLPPGPQQSFPASSNHAANDKRDCSEPKTDAKQQDRKESHAQRKRKTKNRGTQTAEKSEKPTSARLGAGVRGSESSCAGSDEVDSTEFDEVDGVFLDQSAVSLHCHKDEKVRTLLHIVLPRTRFSCRTGQQSQAGACFNSMPNLSSPPMHRPSLGQPLFKSLLVSVGKGHSEYSISSADSEPSVEESSARRERNESFQLMVWGHKNSIP